MPSPTGIFKSLTALQLAELEAMALDFISGKRTSLSGSGRSGSYSYDMTAQEMLREIEFARNPTPNRRAEQIVKRGGRCSSY